MKANSVFRSEFGRLAIMNWYDEQVKNWAVKTEPRLIRTSAGMTYVLQAGSPDAPPVVLLHGNNMNAATMGDLINILAGDFRVFAIDIIGMPGKSAGKRLPHTDKSYAQWLLEVINQLGIQKAAFVGFSFGGWIILNLAAIAGEKIRKTILLDSGGFTQFTMKSKIKAGLGVLLYNWFQNNRMQKWAIDRVFFGPECVPDHDFVRFLGLTYKHLTFNMEFVKHGVPPLLPGELSSFSAPSMVLFGEFDLFFHAEKSLAAARQVIPNVKVGKIVKGQGHVFEKKAAEVIYKDMAEFIKV